MTNPRNPAARLALAARHPMKTVLALALALGGTAFLAAAADAPAPAAHPPAAADCPGRPDGDHHRRHRHHGGPREVDLAEAEQRAKAAFDRVDSNDDDRISPAEVAAAGPGAFGPMGMGGHHGRRHGPPMGPDRMGPGGMGPGGMGPGGMGPGGPQAGDEDDGESGGRPGREQMLAAVFQRLDANKDGKLSTDEFTRLRDAQREEMQARHFARMDADGNGSLSRAEFPPMLAHLRTLDANKDGKVTRDEFPRHHGRHGSQDGRPGDAAPRG